MWRVIISLSALHLVWSESSRTVNEITVATFTQSLELSEKKREKGRKKAAQLLLRRVKLFSPSLLPLQVERRLKLFRIKLKAIERLFLNLIALERN